MKMTDLRSLHARMSRGFRDRTCFAVLAASLLIAGPDLLPAQSLQWDANGTTAGVTDGGGTWNTSGSNWWNGSTNQAWNNAASNIAVFGNGGVVGITAPAAVVTVSGTVNAAGLQFNGVDLTSDTVNNRAYTLSGGTINLSEGAFIRFANGSSTTIGTGRLTLNSALAGSNINVATGTDPAYVTIAGTNTWTGTLTLQAGGGGSFFNIGNLASISSLSAINVQTGNTLVIGYGQTTAMNVPIQINGTGVGNRGAIRIDQSRTLSGAITLTGNASISANASGTVVGTLAGNIGETGASRSLSINTSATTNTITLSGNNTFTGGVILSAGVLRLGSTGAVNASGANLLTFANNTNAKTLFLDGFSATVAGLSTLGTTDTAIIQNANTAPATLTIRNMTTQSFRGALSDGTGGGALSLVKAGPGTQILTAASTYTGSTTVAAGVLQLDFNAAGTPTSNMLSANSALIANGGTLSLTGGSSVANSQAFNGLTVAPGSSTLSLTRNATTPQDLVLNLGTITQQNGGTVNFVLPSGTQSATNGIRTTSSNDASGILGGWATVGSSDWATVSGGNIVAYTGYADITNFSTGAGSTGPLPDNATANVRIINGGTSGNIALGNAGATTTINTLLQSGSNASIIDVASASALRLGTSGGILLAPGAGNLAIGTTANTGTLTAGGNTTGTPGQIIVTTQATGQTVTVNTAIRDNGTGAVSLVKNGAGLLVLTGTTNSNYSGGTYLNGGIVRISADTSLGAVPGSAQAANLTFNGGTLQWGAALTLNANRGITLLANGGTLDVQANITTYGGSITGNGSLTKAGTGTLILSNASSYNGDTTVSEGVLAISNNQALGSSLGGTIVANTAQLRIDSNMTVSGETVTINGTGGNNNGALQANTGVSVIWDGNIIIGTSFARIGGQNNSQLTVNGVIRDGSPTANSLAISTSGVNGVVQFNGLNSYTGATQIIRGTLRLGTSNSLPTTTALTVYTAGTVTETTMFDLNGFNQEVGSLSSIVPNGSNDVVSVHNSNNGTTSTLTVDQSTNTTYNGKITGNLALIKEGSGTLTLTNTYNATTPVASVSNYTGKTTIRAGTLALSGTGNISSTPWIQVDQGATFSISGRTGGNYTMNNQVLSGRGTVDGSLIIGGTTGHISPGDSTGSLLSDAGNGIGELTVNNLTINGGAATLRALFQIAGTGSNLSDPLSSGNPAYFADAGSGGLYDSIQVNGTLGLNAGSTLKVTLQPSYTAQLGDVFNLVDWASINFDADGAGGNGTFSLADLDLSEANAALLSQGWYLNSSQFLTNGVLYVALIPEPSRALFLILGLSTLLMRRRRAGK